MTGSDTSMGTFSGVVVASIRLGRTIWYKRLHQSKHSTERETEGGTNYPLLLTI